MHVVKGKVRTVSRPDGSTYQKCAPDKTFRSGIEMLLWAIRSGEINSYKLPRNGDRRARVSEVHFNRNPGWWGDLFSQFPNYVWTIDHWYAMRAAQQRVRELWHYLSEIEPEWQDGRKIHYMDNSIELIQVNKYGRERRQRLVWPSGDACY
ncbi:hypothetical protein [Streptomyces sp. NPDC053048]|uniref:hypothetical protein n=1 Tax=Streptomyces sp. NPDC053048 TaxID=3365694 RepID=UPI0037D96AD1